MSSNEQLTNFNVQRGGVPFLWLNLAGIPNWIGGTGDQIKSEYEARGVVLNGSRNGNNTIGEISMTVQDTQCDDENQQFICHMKYITVGDPSSERADNPDRRMRIKGRYSTCFTF